MLFSFIIPTHNRQEELALTLAAIGRLDSAKLGECEVIVVDNASRFHPTPPSKLANGIPVRTLIRLENEAAASRNAAAREARGAWLVMLDDDSAPLDEHFVTELLAAPREIAAIGADIRLADGSREHGGLPEVFIGCGVAIRRDIFLKLGGYDPTFIYYAEEYDLAARILIAGYQIIHSRAFRIEHRKVADGRDMNHIIRLLTRNNAWVIQRYAPDDVRHEALVEILSRYSEIAEKENAINGYRVGREELIDSLPNQTRTPLDRALYERFTGIAQTRDHLTRRLTELGARRVSLIDPGKNAWVIRAVLDEAGIAIVPTTDNPDALIIGTLSPGPMLDAWERRQGEHTTTPVLTPWLLPDSVRTACWVAA